MEASDVQIPALRTLARGKAVAAITLLGATVLAFLIWLLYFRSTEAHGPDAIAALPAVNALLNAISSVLLVLGFVAVRRRQYARHIKFMFAALASSTLFFISYVTYHGVHGDTKFLATGIIRPVYFFILITHIVLSAAAIFLILTSLFLALSGRLPTHRRVSRITFPVWLYVSVTGVLIFVMLKAFNP
jgi:putative membrane protein